ncbi:MAG TPA: thioredoxin family protein [Chitinophagales bacterium]|nr:thioredoxin family protein [Chitinophagales bacterium]
MKRLLTGLLLLFASYASSQDTLFWETDVRKAAEASLAEKKPLFLFFTGSDWCGVCKRLQNEVFSQPQFLEWSKNVILVELDFPRNKQPDPRFVEQNRLFKEMFGVTGYPTIVFAAPSKIQNQFYYARIGSLGYMAGGAEVWLNAANQFLSTQK